MNPENNTTFHRQPRRRLRTFRLALQLAYCGSRFSGFQRQPGQRTVEGVLRQALAPLALPDSLSHAGRTDAGVHALGQVLMLRIPEGREPDEVVQSLKNHLPPDIWIRSHRKVPSNFHPRWSAVERRYVYFLELCPSLYPSTCPSTVPSTAQHLSGAEDQLWCQYEGPDFRPHSWDELGAASLSLKPTKVSPSFSPTLFLHALKDLREAQDLGSFAAGSAFRPRPPLGSLGCELLSPACDALTESSWEAWGAEQLESSTAASATASTGSSTTAWTGFSTTSSTESSRASTTTSTGSSATSSTKLWTTSATRSPQLLALHFHGAGFGRYAIRNMVGAALGVATGLLPEDACAQIAAAQRPYRGVRAPAAALVLEEVCYPPEFKLWGGKEEL